MNLKNLLDIAKTELKDLTTLSSPDFRLEQAEYKKDERVWDVVVSYLVENTNKRFGGVAGFTSEFQFHRIYKKLSIDDSGKVIGFYIYEK